MPNYYEHRREWRIGGLTPPGGGVFDKLKVLILYLVKLSSILLSPWTFTGGRWGFGKENDPRQWELEL